LSGLPRPLVREVMLDGDLESRFLVLLDEDGAVRSVPGRDLMTPPKLARDAPGLDVLHPLEIGLFPVLRNELGAPLSDGRDGGLCQRFGVDVPLVGQERLDRHAAAVAVRNHMPVRLDLGQAPKLFHDLDDGLARLEPVEAMQPLPERRLFRRRREALEEVLVVLQRDLRLDRHDVDRAQAMALADLEVVEVVRGRDLDRARALLRIGVFVADDRDAAADDRQDDVPAHQVLVALILRMNGDARVAQHRLRTRGGNRDVGLRVLRIEDLALDRIAEMPEVAVDLALLDLEVRDCRQQLRIPVDEALVLVDQPLLVERDEHLDDGLREALVHGESFAAPVARSAQPLELVEDGAAGFGLPLPDALDEFLAAEVPAMDALGRQLALHDHLRGDARMVHAGLPENVLAAHALEADHDVLQRVVERMAHVQRAGYVGRRDDDGECLRARFSTSASAERPSFFP
jgi:hypothetical protein